MAVASAQIAATDGIQIVGSDVLFDVTGGTLDNSSVVQLNWDDAVFVGQEGKQRLVAALDLIRLRLMTAKQFPVEATS
jgi:hypothetical protein